MKDDIVGTIVGLLILAGLVVVWRFLNRAANHMKDLSEGRTGRFGDASTADLMRRHAELNRNWHFLTDEQRREHDEILHTLLMRGERP